MRRKRCMELSLPLNGYSLESPLNKIFMFLTFHSCFPSFEIVYAMSFWGSSPSLRLWELLVNLVFLAKTENPHSLQQFCSLAQKKKKSISRLHTSSNSCLSFPLCQFSSVQWVAPWLEVRGAKLICLVTQHPEIFFGSPRLSKNTPFRNQIGVIHFRAHPSRVKAAGVLCALHLSRNICTANPEKWMVSSRATERPTTPPRPQRLSHIHSANQSAPTGEASAISPAGVGVTSGFLRAPYSVCGSCLPASLLHQGSLIRSRVSLCAVHWEPD